MNPILKYKEVFLNNTLDVESSWAVWAFGWSFPVHSLRTSNGRRSVRRALPSWEVK